MRKKPAMRLGNVPKMELDAALTTRAFLDELALAFDKHCNRLIEDQHETSDKQAFNEVQLTLPFMDGPTHRPHH